MRESRQISSRVLASFTENWDAITVDDNIRVVGYEEDSEAVAKKLYVFLAAAAHVPPEVTIMHTDAPVFSEKGWLWKS
jgi:hypothetical protein